MSRPPMSGMRLLRVLTVSILVVLLHGCARTPAPALYLLDMPYGAALAGPGRGPIVGIGPIEFPHYLDRPQIITRDDSNRVTAAQAHVWAEPLKISAARVLAVSLARALDSNRVYLLPRRIPTDLEWRVDVVIDRLDGSIGDRAVLAARWALYRAAQQRAVTSRLSLLEQTVSAADYAALTAAETDVLAQLAVEIAAAINAAADQPR